MFKKFLFISIVFLAVIFALNFLILPLEAGNKVCSESKPNLPGEWKRISPKSECGSLCTGEYQDCWEQTTAYSGGTWSKLNKLLSACKRKKMARDGSEGQAGQWLAISVKEGERPKVKEVEVTVYNALGEVLQTTFATTDVDGNAYYQAPAGAASVTAKVDSVSAVWIEEQASVFLPVSLQSSATVAAIAAVAIPSVTSFISLANSLLFGLIPSTPPLCENIPPLKITNQKGGLGYIEKEGEPEYETFEELRNQLQQQIEKAAKGHCPENIKCGEGMAPPCQPKMPFFFPTDFECSVKDKQTFIQKIIGGKTVWTVCKIKTAVLEIRCGCKKKPSSDLKQTPDSPTNVISTNDESETEVTSNPSK